MDTPTIATVVFPAREFEAGVNAWTSVFGTGPTFSSSGQQTAPGEADFAVFKTPDIEIALTSLPWVDEPLLFLDTGDIEQTRQELVDSGATGSVRSPTARSPSSAALPSPTEAPRRGSSRSPGPGSPSFGSPTGTSSAFVSRCPSPGDVRLCRLTSPAVWGPPAPLGPAAERVLEAGLTVTGWDVRPRTCNRNSDGSNHAQPLVQEARLSVHVVVDRTNTAVGALTVPMTGSTHVPVWSASTCRTRPAHGVMSMLPGSPRLSSTARAS